MIYIFYLNNIGYYWILDEVVSFDFLGVIGVILVNINWYFMVGILFWVYN